MNPSLRLSLLPPFFSRRRGRDLGMDTASVVDTLPTLEAVKPLLALEIARARRYGRSLSVMTLPKETVQFLPSTFGRATDVIARWPRNDVVVVFAPETPVDGMVQLARRITGDDTMDEVRCATFPDDGVTLDGLLQAAL